MEILRDERSEIQQNKTVFKTTESQEKSEKCST